jgi:mannobiose 2-epimerase
MIILSYKIMKSHSALSVYVFICLLALIQACAGPANDQGKILSALKAEVNSDMTGNILPWWSGRMTDSINGGFYGRADWQDMVYPDAERGGVVNSRILWTFSSAFRVLGDSSYFKTAKHARDYILSHFIDREHGGVFRSVSSNGLPADMRKQIYIESFFIYGLSEYFRATGDSAALDEAKDIYALIEKYAYDTVCNGYFEVFTREWTRSRDRLIGEKSDLVEKTMNTHLHLLESYTSLYRVWPDKLLEGHLRNLVSIFEDHIIDKNTFHLIPFMERDWKKASSSDSYGHDIESSWLLCEAAGVLGDTKLINRIRKLSLRIADAAAEGLNADGSMATEKDHTSGEVTRKRSWWEQSETVVGYLNAYEITGDMQYLNKSISCWNYINKYFVDHNNGGWYSYVSEKGVPDVGDKAGFWICPYHSGRMCLEVIERIDDL